jgi:hypothetical protein
MSRREDVLFCQLAVSNGIVTKEQAQKALSLCDKKEIETGKRPLIGTLFSKYNLMGAQDVKRIYGAVEKRLGVAVSPQRAEPRGTASRRRGSPRSRADEAAQDGKVRRTKPPDPKTLWLGIGGLVVFLAVLTIIGVIVFKGRGEEGKDSKDRRQVRDGTGAPADSVPEKADATVKPKETGSTATAQTASAKKEPSTPATSVKPPEPTGKRKPPSGELADLNTLLMSARGGDNPAEVEALRRKKKDLEGRGYEVPQDIVDFLAEHAESKSEAATDSSTKDSDKEKKPSKEGTAKEDAAKADSSSTDTDSSKDKDDDNLPADPNPGKESVEGDSK